MPVITLRYQRGRFLEEIVERLAKELPKIVAPQLTISDGKEGDGLVIPEDIIVHCMESHGADVHPQDLEIIIFAHDFPARKANLDERKEGILADVRTFLADYDRNFSGFVWVWLVPTAFGKI